MKKVSFAEAVDRFLDDRRIEGYATRTIRHNGYSLRLCMQSVGKDADVARVTRMHVTRMLEEAVNRGNDDSTINTLMSTLSAFFKWCRAEGLMPPDSNPMQGRRYRKVIPRDHTMVNLSEFPVLLDTAEDHHPRDRMFVALGLYTMMRQSEIASLRVGDINLELNLIDAVIHKTRDRDSMRIVPELRTELRAWLTYYTTACGPLKDSWFLVPTTTRAGFTRPGGTYERLPDVLVPDRAMSKPHLIVHRALVAMGWDLEGKHIGSHTLRRSAARACYSELVAEGVDDALRQTGAFLHHKSVTQTEKYLNLTIDRERRNRKYEDAPLYPSLQAANVTALRSLNGEAHAS